MNNTAILQRNHWVFDLDGTLTVPCHDFPDIKRQLDIPQQQDILSHFNTLSTPELQAKLAILDRIETRLAEQARPLQGAAELVHCLAQTGIKLGILTRNAKACAHLTLERIGLDKYFEPNCILGRSEASPKPNPEGLHKLLSYWQAPAQDCLMIGDYHYDLAAGRAAGMATVHLDTASQFPWPEQTDLAIDSLQHLLSLFRNSRNKPACD